MTDMLDKKLPLSTANSQPTTVERLQWLANLILWWFVIGYVIWRTHQLGAKSLLQVAKQIGNMPSYELSVMSMLIITGAVVGLTASRLRKVNPSQRVDYAFVIVYCITHVVLLPIVLLLFFWRLANLILG